MKIKKGDQVKIIAGNDKGKQGKVLAVLPKEKRVLVGGVNLKKKHVKPRRQGQKGELVRTPRPIVISRVMLICSKCGRAGRFGYKKEAVGSKIRVCKKCGGEM